MTRRKPAHHGYVQGDGRTWKGLCGMEDARPQEGAGCMSPLSWKSRECGLVSSDRKQICHCLGVPKGQEELLRVPRVHYSPCGDLGLGSLHPRSTPTPWWFPVRPCVSCVGAPGGSGSPRLVCSCCRCTWIHTAPMYPRRRTLTQFCSLVFRLRFWG